MADTALRVCFLSHQYPPAVGGGIGRFTADLARGFAKAGHDVHVMSAQGEVSTLTLEEGVWVHRFPPYRFAIEELRNELVYADLQRIGCFYREVLAAHGMRPFDIVSSPIFLADGLLCALDPRFVSVVSLHTSTKALAEIDARWAALANTGPRTRLEALCLQAHRHTHANSAASLAKITKEYGTTNGAFVIHHGVEDHAARFFRRRPPGAPIRILVTGRQEMRKGADILLEIIPQVLALHSNVELVLVGEAMPIAEL
jgi:glycogen synthase